jgi:hypothetical protein
MFLNLDPSSFPNLYINVFMKNDEKRHPAAAENISRQKTHRKKTPKYLPKSSEHCDWLKKSLRHEITHNAKRKDESDGCEHEE